PLVGAEEAATASPLAASTSARKDMTVAGDGVPTGCRLSRAAIAPSDELGSWYARTGRTSKVDPLLAGARRYMQWFPQCLCGLGETTSGERSRSKDFEALPSHVAGRNHESDGRGPVG